MALSEMYMWLRLVFPNMAESFVWIAKGVEVSDNINITLEQFLNKTDQAMLNLIYPLIDNLIEENLVRWWYTSRAWDQKKGITPRVRIYLNLEKSKTGIVNKIIEDISKVGDTKMVKVVPPSNSNYPDSHFRIIQKSSALARKLLPRAMKRNRREETFLKQIDRLIENNPEIRNRAGIHWLENNLGFETDFLGNRYNCIW